MSLLGAGCEAGGPVHGGIFGRGAGVADGVDWVCGAWAEVGDGVGEREKAGSSR